MKKNPLNKGVLTDNGEGIGPVTDDLLQARARELAMIEGRSRASAVDFERARREMSGGQDVDPKDAVLESAPEAERWDPLPGSPGREAPEAPPEDEDDEGRSETEQLVDEGVEEAGRDQMVQAARDARNRRRSGK